MTGFDGHATASPVEVAARRNSVLAAVPLSRSLTSAMELVSLDNEDVVHTVGQPIVTVLFPVSCVVSIASRDGGDDLDVTTVGREGLVGLPGLLGAGVHALRATCRVPGQALRLPTDRAQDLLADNSEGRAVLHRYVRGSMADLMQRIACNRAHSSEARCACWLLKTSDRVGDDAFELRHATLATMLGVRRATVTDSLARLQRTGTVRSSRGTITVLDRRALEAAACDCSAFFRRVLPMTAARPVSSSAAV